MVTSKGKWHRRPPSHSFTVAERRQIRDRAGGVCEYCHQPVLPDEPTECHHRVAVVDGGEAHDVANGMYLHERCHSANYAELHPGHDHKRRRVSGAAMRGFLYRRGVHKETKAERAARKAAEAEREDRRAG